MARKKVTGKARRDPNSKRSSGEGASHVQADHNSVAIGGIHIGGDLSGSFTIGYTVEQVSNLLKEITSGYRRKPFNGRCPYKGLDVFEEEDADLFFGRERLVEELLGRVRASRSVFITGPSGSGKSSLARAGVIHRLKQAAIRGGDRWLYETMKPGREPLKELALAFSRLKSPELANYFLAHAAEIDSLHQCAESVLSGRKDQRFVLFVDQFEETFTQISQDEERVAFINILVHAATVENGRVIVLFAMRSDFLSNCTPYPQLNALVNRSNLFLVGDLQPEELVQSIALPALHVGLPVEPQLIARIINDMKGEPGALPLMQFALKDLFDAQMEKGGVVSLRLEDYLQHGGIQKSLARHADATLAALSEAEQALTRSIFSSLIEIGRGTADTRRTALFDELVPAGARSEKVLGVVQKLADARLVITDEQAGADTVTISHEKLIDAWPWLRHLVNENRDVIALQNEIAADAKEWDDHRRDPSYLYVGARLANAREKLEARKLVLSDTAQEFIHAGQGQQRRSQRNRLLGVGVPVALVVVGILVFTYVFTTNAANLSKQNEAFANTQQAAASTSQAIAVTAQSSEQKAQEQALVSRAGELAALSTELREKDFQLSLLLAVEAFHTKDIVRSRGALLDLTNASPQLVQYLPGNIGAVANVAFSPNGKMLASGSQDNTIILWGTETRQPIGEPLRGHASWVESIAFSPNGNILASAGSDEKIILWDVATHQMIGEPFTVHQTRISIIAFSPDGTTLAVGDFDSVITFWDVASRQTVNTFRGHTRAVIDMDFSPDGTLFASRSIDGEILLWDLETRQVVAQPFNVSSESALDLAFSPDSSTLAYTRGDGSIFLWDVATRQVIGDLLLGDGNAVTSLAFSPDGETLASGKADNTILLWDVAERKQLREPLRGHTGPAYSVAFSPDGQTFASSGIDGKVILWAMEAKLAIAQPFLGQPDVLTDVDFSPDGTTLASSGFENGIVLWDVETRQPIGATPVQQARGVASIAFSPDGKTLAYGGLDKTVQLWDVATRRPVGAPLAGHGGLVTSVAFSPDGTMLASAGSDNTVILWELATGKAISSLLNGHGAAVSSVAFSPDSKTLASGSHDNTIILWDVETHRAIGEPLAGHFSWVESIAFSPNGQTLASGGLDTMIILWNVETHEKIGQPLVAHTFPVVSLGFSPGGETLVSGSGDDTIILWDVETRQAIGQPLTLDRFSVDSLVFSPDGKSLVTAGNTMLIGWDIFSESWVDRSCLRAGRNFTHTEWERYFTGETYRQTCEQWPLER